MTTQDKKLLIIASRGLDDERATVSFTIANGGIAEGLDVTVFLVSSGVDLVRKGALESARMNPLDAPLKELVEGFMEKGGSVWACPPCAKIRGYDGEDLLDGVVVTGSAAVHGLLKEGAATLCF
jgi:predicted peroxiredoxin